MEKEIDTFLHFLQVENFLEAHEVLEESWRKYKSIPALRDESFILKGLINGATAFVLLQLGREASAHKVWATFQKYEPLIDTIVSEYSPKYKRAQEILLNKYKKFFTCKSI